MVASATFLCSHDFTVPKVLKVVVALLRTTNCAGLPQTKFLSCHDSMVKE